MRHILNIIKGWYRFLFKKRSQMAKERLEICFQCKERRGIMCGVCFCELHAKAEIKQEDCPIGKWEDSNKYYESGERKHPLSNQTITDGIDMCDEKYNFIDGGYVPPSK